MKKDIESNNQSDKKVSENTANALQGYPLYPASEDIYNKYKKEGNLDPEDVSKEKVSNVVHPIQSITGNQAFTFPVKKTLCMFSQK